MYFYVCSLLRVLSAITNDYDEETL